MKEKCQEGEVSVSFTPLQVGQYKVSVTFGGRHLQGSPFSLEVVDQPIYRRDYREVGGHPVSQFGLGRDDSPESASCNSKGEIVVASSKCRIQVFDRYGKFLFRFGSEGKGNGQFSPCGVTIDQRNNQIVVADNGNHRIQIFDEKGAFIRVFGSRGKGVEQFDDPSGIVVDQQGNYVVADGGNHRIQIFNSQGLFMRKFGSHGAGNGQMNSPLVLAFCRMGILW